MSFCSLRGGIEVAARIANQRKQYLRAEESCHPRPIDGCYIFRVVFHLSCFIASISRKTLKLGCRGRRGTAGIPEASEDYIFFHSCSSPPPHPSAFLPSPLLSPRRLPSLYLRHRGPSQPHSASVTSGRWSHLPVRHSSRGPSASRRRHGTTLWRPTVSESCPSHARLEQLALTRSIRVKCAWRCLYAAIGELREGCLERGVALLPPDARRKRRLLAYHAGKAASIETDRLSLPDAR